MERYLKIWKKYILNESQIQVKGEPDTSDAAMAFEEAKQAKKGDNYTRKRASKDAYYAVMYAFLIDRGPHPVTRAGACREPRRAWEYAQMVDKDYHEMTYAAVSEDEYYAKYYANFLQQLERKGGQQQRQKPAQEIDRPGYSHFNRKYSDKAIPKTGTDVSAAVARNRNK